MTFYVGNSDDIGVGKTVFGSRRHVLGEFWAQRDRWLQGRPLRQGNTEKNSHQRQPGQGFSLRQRSQSPVASEK
jgi:hypothetical protein